MKKQPLIEKLLTDKAEKNNTIDLNAYALGLDDMHKALVLHDVSGSLPTEEQVLQTIFDCVCIRGIELEDYKRNFTSEQCGLYDALVKLFKGNDR